MDKVCYWDPESRSQKERDMTPEEQAELDARRAVSLPESSYVMAVQQMLDAGAAKKNYDDIHSAALRAGFSGPYQADGTAYATWMDSCWQQCYSTLADVKSGKIPAPTVAALLALLPPCPF